MSKLVWILGITLSSAPKAVGVQNSPTAGGLNVPVCHWGKKKKLPGIAEKVFFALFFEKHFFSSSKLLAATWDLGRRRRPTGVSSGRGLGGWGGRGACGVWPGGCVATSFNPFSRLKRPGLQGMKVYT